MAQFRATIQGNRGEASRCGNKNSGIHATINGWHVGITVVAEYDRRQERDVFTVFKTSGSSGYGQDKLIGRFSQPPTERNRNE